MALPSDYRELALPAPDAQRIESLWASQASADGLHRVLPDGRMDLIVRYRLDRDGRIAGARLVIAGPSTRFADIPVAQGDGFLGVRFAPGWGGACLGVAPARLREKVWLDEQASAALGPADAASLLGADSPDALQGRLLAIARRRAWRAPAPAKGMCAAIARMHAGQGRLPLPALAAASGLGERSLRRHLAERIGLGFSAFSTVLRFQRALRLLATGHATTLTQLAADCGYSDQADMTRAFRRHGGFTPGQRPPVTLVGLPLQGVAAIFKPD